MTAKKKSNNAFQENFMKGLGFKLGIAAAAGLLALFLAWYNGAFDSNTNTNPPPRPSHQTDGVKPGEGRG